MRQQLNLRIDSGLEELLQEASDRLGKTKTRIAKEAIWLFLGVGDSTQAPKPLVEELRSFVRRLESKSIGLSQKGLSRRLASVISAAKALERYLEDPDCRSKFRDWSRERDPDGIAWEYDEELMLCFPLLYQPDDLIARLHFLELVAFGLNQKELGIRLGKVDGSVVGKAAKALGPEKFAQYTKKRDPLGLPWKVIHKDGEKRYYLAFP